jgi:hypothetical protein
MARAWKVADSIRRSQARKSSRVLMKAHREWEESPASKHFNNILIESSEHDDDVRLFNQCLSCQSNAHLSLLSSDDTYIRNPSTRTIIRTMPGTIQPNPTIGDGDATTH